MVGHNLIGILQVIDHHPCRLLYPLVGQVSRTAEPFHARAIAEMKAGDGIERPPLVFFFYR
jgi:hypothetical protein